METNKEFTCFLKDIRTRIMAIELALAFTDAMDLSIKKNKIYREFSQHRINMLYFIAGNTYLN